MIQWFKQLFIPNEENEYNPHSLREKAVLGLALMVCLTFVASNTHALLWSTSKWMVSTVLPAVIVDLTNEERDAYNLGDLRRSSVLDEAARLKAEHMAKNEYFAHYSPDGISPWYWFGQTEYNFVHAGENLAIHFNDSGEVVDAWMKSPTHKENIVNGDYTEIGVGTAKGEYEGFDTVYVVQLFGTPAATPEVAAAALSTPTAPPDIPVEVVEPDQTPKILIDIPVEIISENSEAVTITEEVIYSEPEPIPMIVYNEVEVADEAPVILANETDDSNTESESVAPASDVDVVAMEQTETGIALYSDHISTSTGGIPATINPDGGEYSNSGATPMVYKLASQPNALLTYIYTVLAMFVGSALLLSVFVDIRRQQPVQVAYSIALLVLMTVLWSVHSYLTAGAVIA